MFSFCDQSSVVDEAIGYAGEKSGVPHDLGFSQVTFVSPMSRYRMGRVSVRSDTCRQPRLRLIGPFDGWEGAQTECRLSEQTSASSTRRHEMGPLTFSVDMLAVASGRESAHLEKAGAEQQSSVCFSPNTRLCSFPT